MNIDWMWLLIGLAVGVLFGASIKTLVSSAKSKVTGG